MLAPTSSSPTHSNSHLPALCPHTGRLVFAVSISPDWSQFHGSTSSRNPHKGFFSFFANFFSEMPLLLELVSTIINHKPQVLLLRSNIIHSPFFLHSTYPFPTHRFHWCFHVSSHLIFSPMRMRVLSELLTVSSWEYRGFLMHSGQSIPLYWLNGP